jgi:hypothetical protein
LSESNPILPPLQPIEPGSRSVRGESTSEGGLWLYAIEDLIMWKDVPRSSLLFGASCFFILSASFVKDMSCRVLTLTAYVGMIRLAAVFFHRTFLSRYDASPELTISLFWFSSAETCTFSYKYAFRKDIRATN